MKKIIFTALVATSLFSGAIFAAGQGGIAGSASMITNAGGFATDVSASIAIGKSTAQSNAHTSNTVVSTWAAGAGGTITISPTGYLEKIDVESKASLAINQTNAMDKSTVSIDAKAGTIDGDAITAEAVD